MTRLAASAPGKVILFGEHSVNRGQLAVATAVDRRVYCRVTEIAEGSYSFRSGEHGSECDREALLRFRAEIDGLRDESRLEEIREHARRDFFAPSRYVLAQIVEHPGAPGLAVEWHSDLPSGSGLGSGAAASAAMALAALRAVGGSAEAAEVARLAWQGDVIAHGGVASAMDSGACALGGVTRCTTEGGPELLAGASALPLVIGDSRVRANTAEVNTRVLGWLDGHPARMHLFSIMGWLVPCALDSLLMDGGPDLAALGRLMNLNQSLLEKLGVSCPEIDRLVQAALGAGALGAKLSGSGGGGIIIALAEPGQEAAVAAAMEAAGGQSMVVRTAAAGVRMETDAATAW
jgi:mevalonate kinase